MVVLVPISAIRCKSVKKRFLTRSSRSLTNFVSGWGLFRLEQDPSPNRTKYVPTWRGLFPVERVAHAQIDNQQFFPFQFVFCGRTICESVTALTVQFVRQRRQRPFGCRTQQVQGVLVDRYAKWQLGRYRFAPKIKYGPNLPFSHGCRSVFDYNSVVLPQIIGDSS